MHGGLASSTPASFCGSLFVAYRFYVVYHQIPLGPDDSSFRALSRSLTFMARRRKFNKDNLPLESKTAMVANPPGKCSYEWPTRGTVCGAMGSMCGADAGCFATNYESRCRARRRWWRSTKWSTSATRSSRTSSPTFLSKRHPPLPASREPSNNFIVLRASVGQVMSLRELTHECIFDLACVWRLAWHSISLYTWGLTFQLARSRIWKHHVYLTKWFQKVNSSTKPSTYCLSSLIKTIS